MPVEVQLKLQDLAKIALGAPELTNVNIEVLHSLIHILLKKLSCENETVELGAFETQHLQKILEKSKISSLAFNDDNVELIAKKLERIEYLEQDINHLETKLDNHLKYAEAKSNVEETKLDWEKWDTYGTEDLCTICDTDNEIACKLLKNTDFLKKLLRRISSPMVDRIFHFEAKLKKLSEDFNAFIKRAEDEYVKIQLLETCIFEIELLRKKVDENQTQFICTMEEVQDMMDAKLDKIHMPALKKYIKDNFVSIEESIKALQQKKECPRAAGIIMDGVRCVSCGSTHVCTEVGVENTPLLPDVTTGKQYKVIKHCKKEKDIDCHKVVDSKEKPMILNDRVECNIRKTSRREETTTNCAPKIDFDFVEGIDGILYRKG